MATGKQPYLTEQEQRDVLDGTAALRQYLAETFGPRIVTQPRYADVIDDIVDRRLARTLNAAAAAAPPPDEGLTELIGLGDETAATLGATYLPPRVDPYDETVTSERLIAVADLYYHYNHEKIGVYRVVRKLQELFRAGTIRLSSGSGALGLYRFDRRQVLRYTRRDRFAAYRRLFGYTREPAPPGATPNRQFHGLLVNFMKQVADFWRDKRVSEVVRNQPFDPSFGSIAIVRRSGLDLRNNLKNTSYGHLNVLRVEVMQLLDEAFRVLNSPDIRAQFGADNAWDVIEEVLTRYFNVNLVTSPRQRMAVAGREVLEWLAQPYVLQTSRAQFEALLLDIAEYAEEWLTSAVSVGAVSERIVGGALAGTRMPLPVANGAGF